MRRAFRTEEEHHHLRPIIRPGKSREHERMGMRGLTSALGNLREGLDTEDPGPDLPATAGARYADGFAAVLVRACFYDRRPQPGVPNWAQMT